jgi:hypothetical protein
MEPRVRSRCSSGDADIRAPSSAFARRSSAVRRGVVVQQRRGPSTVGVIDDAFFAGPVGVVGVVDHVAAPARESVAHLLG